MSKPGQCCRSWLVGCGTGQEGASKPELADRVTIGSWLQLRGEEGVSWPGNVVESYCSVGCAWEEGVSRAGLAVGVVMACWLPLQEEAVRPGGGKPGNFVLWEYAWCIWHCL